MLKGLLLLILVPVPAFADTPDWDECAQAVLTQYREVREIVNESPVYRGQSEDQLDEVAKRGSYSRWIQMKLLDTSNLQAILDASIHKYRETFATSLKTASSREQDGVTKARLAAFAAVKVYHETFSPGIQQALNELHEGRELTPQLLSVLYRVVTVQVSLIKRRAVLMQFLSPSELDRTLSFAFSPNPVDPSVEVSAEKVREIWSLSRRSVAYDEDVLAAHLDESEHQAAFYIPEIDRRRASTGSVAIEQAELILQEGGIPAQFLTELKIVYQFLRRYEIEPFLDFKNFVQELRRLKALLAHNND